MTKELANIGEQRGHSAPSCEENNRRSVTSSCCDNGGDIKKEEADGEIAECEVCVCVCVLHLHQQEPSPCVFCIIRGEKKLGGSAVDVQQ